MPNTFFVNLGRSTNLREWLGKGVTRSKAKLADREAVHLIKKTGWPRFVLETALARPVGLSSFPRSSRSRRKGMSWDCTAAWTTSMWSRRFHELPDEELEADVDESYRQFVRHFGEPVGFSSPGFYSDERVMRLLDRLGFLYNGDAIGGEPHHATAEGAGASALDHARDPVGPRTIPFLEYHGANADAEVNLRLLDEHLDAQDR